MSAQSLEEFRSFLRQQEERRNRPSLARRAHNRFVIVAGSLRRPGRRGASALALAVATVLLGTAAVAAWLSLGSGAGAATATTVARANTPTASLDGASVAVAWAPSTLASGVAVDSYDVLRHDGAAVTTVCARVTSTSCQDTSPSARAVQYGVVARKGATWAGPESALSGVVVADVSKPVSTLALNPAPNVDGYARGAVTATLTATDTGSGVERLVWSVDGAPGSSSSASATFVVSGTGSHSVAYHAVDKAGNVEETHTTTFTIDPDQPTTTVSYTDSSGTSTAKKAWYRDDVRLDFSGTDASGSGASGVKSVTVDGVTTSGRVATKSVTAPGPTEVAYFATDKADNVEDVKRTTVQIDRADPVATIDPATTQAWYRVATKTFTLNASDLAGVAGSNSGVASVTYAVDGAAASTVTQLPFTPATPLGQGDHTITYFATDNAGRVQPTQTAKIRIDNGTPTFEPGAQPAANTAGWHSSDVTVTAGAKDSVSGVASQGVATSENGSYLAHQVVSTEGTTTLYLRATDAAGNSATGTTTVKLDKTKPVISSVVPSGSHRKGQSWAAGPTASNESCGAGLVCADVADSGSGVASVSYTMTSGTSCFIPTGSGSQPTVAAATSSACLQVMTMRAGTGTWSSGTAMTLPNGNNATYTITVSVFDVAGNQQTRTSSVMSVNNN